MSDLSCTYKRSLYMSTDSSNYKDILHLGNLLNIIGQTGLIIKLYAISQLSLIKDKIVNCCIIIMCPIKDLFHTADCPAKSMFDDQVVVCIYLKKT